MVYLFLIIVDRLVHCQQSIEQRNVTMISAEEEEKRYIRVQAAYYLILVSLKSSTRKRGL